MNFGEILSRLDTIRAYADESGKCYDFEMAHMEEKRLFVDLLMAIADKDVNDPAAYAAEALKSLELDFLRIYA